MTFDLVLSGGLVLTPDGISTADVGITSGRIETIGSDLSDAAETIDCTGAWVGPGFVDLHAHLREPGQEWKEDIASGCATAARGGYTALVSMPNTDPPIDSAPLARFVSEQARTTGIMHVVSAGCLTMGRAGERMAHLDDLWACGVRIFTDDGDSVSDPNVLRVCMEYLKELGGVVSQHAMDPDMSRHGHIHEGSVSSRLGMVGISSDAEHITIERDITLARLTGVKYHVQHVSTARSVELIATAKAEGLSITAEVTPHHLMFSHEDVKDTDPNFKMMPPLREYEDAEALIVGLRAGVIDLVATDHAPHATFEKDVPFEEAPNGVIGLEWAGAVVNTAVQLDQKTFFDRMSMAPSKLAGFDHHGLHLVPGGPANVTVFDPLLQWTPADTVSKASNSPYLGRHLTGRVLATVFNGTVTHELPSMDGAS